MSEEILSRGTFRVDRRRALEKMEKFQLADPVAYVVELVAAAVLAGAPTIEVTNDADDLVIGWQGALPTRAELDGVFDALFGTPADPHGAMLQHLGMGVLGALGQAPRWLYVDRGPAGGEPALRLAVVDPLETRSVEHEHTAAGVRVHVRRPLGFGVVGRALAGLFTEPPESRLIRARARWCPVPLVINGRPLPTGPATSPPPRAIGREHTFTAAEGEGQLWLVRDRHATVDLVRHGLTVGQQAVIVGPFALAGYMRHDALELDASRATLLEDANLTAARDRLQPAARSLAHALAATGDATSTTELLDVAVWCVANGHPLGPLGARPLLTSVDGRQWSIDDARIFAGPKGLVDDPALREAGHLLFSAADPRTALLLPNLVDRSEELRRRRLGRERRQAATPHPPTFPGSTHQAPFEDGLLRGSVRWGGGENPTILTHLRVGGVEVEQVHLPSPAGPMEAILDHPALLTDEAFETVLVDPTRDAAVATLDRVALTFASDHMVRVSRGSEGGPLPLAVLTAALRALGARSRQDLSALLEKHPDNPVLRAPAFRAGDGVWRSLTEVLAVPSDPDNPMWILIDPLPAGCPAELTARVLRVPASAHGTWEAWLPGRARSGAGTLEEEIRGAQRRSQPPRTAVLPRRILHRVAVSAEGWRGELGLDGAGPAAIDLLRAGIPIQTVAPSLALPGIVGVLDRLDARVNRAHDGLADADALPRLTDALRPYLETLARAAWGDAPIPPPPVVTWLCQTPSLPDWALERPVARTIAGQPWTLTALRALAGKKHHARIKLVSSTPDAPGFDDAIQVDPELRRLLTSLGGRAVRDADEDLAGARRNLAQYRERPIAVAPAALHRATLDVAGTHVELLLPADPDRVGVLRVDAIWTERVLASWDRGENLGLHVRVTGAGIAPAASMSMLADPNQLSKWSKTARSELAPHVAAALDARADIPPRERATWRALLARLDGAKEPNRAESALRSRIAALPLFVRLDGTVVSRDAIQAEAEAWRVPMETTRGVTDTPWYILEEPWAAAALPALGSGAERLATWREAEHRRRTLPRREAKLEDRGIYAGPFADEGAMGEIALFPLDRGGGLTVTALVDGVALEPVTLPFPCPAGAIVTGSTIKADPALKTWPGSPAAERVRAALVRATHTLARALAAEATRYHEASRWIVAYALDAPQGADLPVFQTLDGVRTTAAALRLRPAVGVVAAAAAPLAFVTGASPVVAPPWLQEALDDRFSLVDMAFVVERHARRLTPAPPLGGVAEPGTAGRTGAAVAWAPDGAIQVLRDGVLLDTLGPAEQGAPIPLTGYVCADAEVDASWASLTPASLAAVQDRLTTLARTLIAAAVSASNEPDATRSFEARAHDRLALAALHGLLLPLERGSPLPVAEGPHRASAGRGLSPLAAENPPAEPGYPRLAPDFVGGSSSATGIRPRFSGDSRGPSLPEPGTDPAGRLATPHGRREAAPPKTATPDGRFATLAEAMTGDPLLATLAQRPLWRDVTGRPGSLVDLVRDAPVRCVALGVVGRTLPGRTPTWQVDPADRPLVALFRPVLDATEALTAETLGMKRREAARGPRPVAPLGAGRVQLDPSCGAEGELWLDPLDESPERAVRVLAERAAAVARGQAGVHVRVDGAYVMAWPCRLVELGGWVEGDFPTDATFMTATLPANTLAALRAATTRLLQDLPPDARRRRVSAALESGIRPADLVNQPDVDWGALTVFVDSAGLPVTLHELLKLLKGTLVVGPEGALPPKRGARVLVGGDAELATLRRWFPDARVAWADAIADEAEQKRKTNAEKKARSTVARRQAAMVDAARKVLARWTGGATVTGVAEFVAAWATSGVTGWPAFDAVDASGEWPLHVAFAVGGADPEARIRIACAMGMATREA